MMRIFRVYHEQTCGEGAVRLIATPEERRRHYLRVGGWSLWIIIMLACGYYGHFIWRQYFPPRTESVDSEAVRKYWLSDVHYVFKKNPLPARIDIDPDEAEEESVASEEQLNSDEDVSPETNNEYGGSEHDALRLRVKQALEAVDDEQP